jgi:hypothetical protein
VVTPLRLFAGNLKVARRVAFATRHHAHHQREALERLDRQLTDGLFADQDLFGPTSARLSRSAFRLRHAGP